MTDGEFWDYVLQGVRPGERPDYDDPYDDDPPDPAERLGAPCTVCGSPGACGVDLDGRPMIHVQEDVEEILGFLPEPLDNL